MTTPLRVNHQPAFLLSSSPWRESSLLIEVFTKDYGRIILIARSARKKQSQLRGILMPFIPIDVSWYGSKEIKILHDAEWVGGWPQPQGQALLSGLYIHELIRKLTVQEDSLPTLYHVLFETMRHISHGNYISSLRYFEWTLLKSLGVAPDIQKDSEGNPIIPHAQYWIQVENTPIKLSTPIQTPPSSGLYISGESLLALQNATLSLNTKYQQEIMHLTRMLLNFRLPDNIHSRKILQQLQQLTPIQRIQP